MCIRDRYYTQNDGLPMGSPISSILEEVFLQHLEKTKILTNNDRHSHKILYWHRYVDDILILYRGNKRQCEQLITHINKIHKNITFTVEYEHNNSINFCAESGRFGAHSPYNVRQTLNAIQYLKRFN